MKEKQIKRFYHKGACTLSGYLSTERDFEALAQNLGKLVLSSESWVEFGYNARQYLEEEYNVKKQILKLENLYQKVAYLKE